MAVNNRSEIKFAIPQASFPCQQISVGFIHRIAGYRWMQATSGAAGRANVGLCVV